ncbi:hypothetical protein EIP86_007330 [Pleurotus ostreatoroseus]|nr:hypothetical protein EIP86_007330 [Pleurotus ostreatoroseus]
MLLQKGCRSVESETLIRTMVAKPNDDVWISPSKTQDTGRLQVVHLTRDRLITRRPNSLVTQYPPQPGSAPSMRPTSYMVQNEANAPSAQMPTKDNEIPSGPRNHLQAPPPLPGLSAQAPTRVLSFTGRPYNPPANPFPNSFEPYTPPAWKLGRPTRFDTQPSAINSLATTNQVKEAMDVDYPARSKLSEANDATSRSASNIRTEYSSDPSMGSVPTGPRAMSRSMSGIGTQKRSPDALTPPAPATNQSSSRRAPSNPSRTPSPVPGFEWRRIPGSKHGLWHVAGTEVSETNDVPLGGKGRPPRDNGPVTWKHPSTIIYQTESHRPPINHVHVSPTTHRKPLPPDSVHRMSSIETRGVLDKGFQGPSTLPVSSQPPPADKPPKVSSERSGRPSRFGPEPTHSIPPPPQSQPQAEERVWLTREESQRLERDAERNELYGQVKSPVLARKQNEPYTRLRPGDRPQRQYEQPQGPPQQVNQNRYPDNRQRGRPPSLERRLSSKVYPSPHLDPPRSRSYRDGPVGDEDTRQDGRPALMHRKSAHLSRTGLDVHGDEPQRERDASPGSTKVHPDRVRLISDPPPDELDRRSEDRRSYPEPSMHPHPSRPVDHSPTSKHPVRLRRPGKSPEREDSWRLLERPISIHDFEPIPPQHQPVQRGGSLLDRLTLDSPPATLPGPSPSLRDRVELPMKRIHEDPHGLPARPPAEVTNDVESGFDGRGRGNGRKRGSGKLKRGRK